MTFIEWMRHDANCAMHQCYDGIYVGEEGAKRFAREVGPCLLDFPDADPGATYSGICVIAYRLKPPIDAKTWLTELRKGMDAAREITRVPIPEDYEPVAVVHLDEIAMKKAMWRSEG